MRGSLLLFTALVLAACAAESGRRPIADWSLDRDGAEAIDVHVPSRLPLPAHDLVYSLRTNVALDPRITHDLVVPALPASVALFADGRRCIALAPPDDHDRNVAPVRFRIPRQPDGRVTLELRTAHTWAHSGDVSAVPVLVRAGVRTLQERRIEAINVPSAWLGLVAACAMAMAFLPIFALDRSRTAYLWVTVQALTAAPYCAFVLGLTQPLLGRYDAVVVYASLVIAATASVHFTHTFFELDRPHRGWSLLGAIAFVVALAYPDPFAHHAGRAMACTVALVTIYQAVTCARLIRTSSDRATAIVLFVSWACLGLFVWPELVLAAGGPDPLAGVRPSGIGIGLFAVAMGVLLSGRFHRLLTEADRQLEAIRTRQQENEVLSQRLREQIAERSAQLFAALAAADGRIVAMPEPGQLVDGEYEIIGQRGRGGMSRVYEARRRSDGSRVALKISTHRQPEALARLAREAQIAVSLDHPHVVRVLDVRMSEGGFLYLVLELVDGRTLSEYVDAQRPSLERLVDLLAQVIDGLRALHALGIVHRDLKPENVLVAGDPPSIKLVDFGISRSADGATESSDGTVREDRPQTPDRLTRTGQLTGTPSYLAPELAASDAITAAADVFSFGVVAFELLAGRRPWNVPPLFTRFEGRDPAPARSLRRVRPDLVPELANVVQRCLELDPARRPRLDEIALVLRGRATVRRRIEPTPPRAPA